MNRVCVCVCVGGGGGGGGRYGNISIFSMTSLYPFVTFFCTLLFLRDPTYQEYCKYIEEGKIHVLQNNQVPQQNEICLKFSQPEPYYSAEKIFSVLQVRDQCIGHKNKLIIIDSVFTRCINILKLISTGNTVQDIYIL